MAHQQPRVPLLNIGATRSVELTRDSDDLAEATTVSADSAVQSTLSDTIDWTADSLSSTPRPTPHASKEKEGESKVPFITFLREYDQHTLRSAVERGRHGQRRPLCVLCRSSEGVTNFGDIHTWICGKLQPDTNEPCGYAWRENRKQWERACKKVSHPQRIERHFDQAGIACLKCREFKSFKELQAKHDKEQAKSQKKHKVKWGIY